jgi:hypothetical protein
MGRWFILSRRSESSPTPAPHNLILMGNSRFDRRLVVWPGRLNNGVKHHGKRFGSGVRPANEEVQLVGGPVRSGGENHHWGFIIAPPLDFLGNSANAVRWQVWTAPLLYVLIRFLCVIFSWNNSFTRLFTLLRAALWRKIDLWDLLRFSGTAGGHFRCLATPQPGSLSNPMG